MNSTTYIVTDNNSGEEWGTGSTPEAALADAIEGMRRAGVHYLPELVDSWDPRARHSGGCDTVWFIVESST